MKTHKQTSKEIIKLEKMKISKYCPLIIRKTSEAGITLVALVCGIIVLLILAGVTLTLALSNNGVMDRAQYASNKWANATKDENTMMAKIEEQVITLSNYDEQHQSKVDNSEEITGVNFGNKNAKTIEVGEDLTIGNELFRILSTDKSTTIVAIPFYNIALDINNPAQTNDDTPYWTTYSKFSTSNYWGQGTDIIDMTDDRNIIQKYISAYSNKLLTLTSGKVMARIARNSEISDSAIRLPENSNITKNQIRNPSQKRKVLLGWLRLFKQFSL